MYNPEMRRGMLIYILVLAIVCGICAYFGAGYAAAAFIASAAIFSVSMYMDAKRYKNIRDISAQINRVLNGCEYIQFDKYKEGELAVLESEISKMTIRLLENSEALKKEKIFLCDSLADISHQLKTPLTSMNIIAAMLAEPDLKSERRIELANDLTKLLSKTEWLTSTLLRISKLDADTVSFSSQKIQVNELVKKAYEPLAIPMELREQKLLLDIPNEVCTEVDIQWTVQAIGNILKNCMEHTDAGKNIKITASENAIFTQITIIDEGSGIAEEDLSHLFERFYRGKNSSDSSVGIGLALSKMIITRQNGTLKAGNNPGGGAYFNIRFYKTIL